MLRVAFLSIKIIQRFLDNFYGQKRNTQHLQGVTKVFEHRYFSFFSAISLSKWTIFFLNNLQISCSTRIQKKNFEKSFLRPLKIKNTKKFVEKTMKVMLNFSKFLQNRVFQVILRGYTCFLSKKSDMQKSWSRPVVRTLDLLGPNG